jgi:hypothetical protein
MSGPGRQREAAELARELNLRISSLYPELLPAAEVRGMWARVGSLAGEKGDSLAIYLKGPKQGRWRDYAADVGGDALDLIAQIHCNGNIREAMDWGRQWLGGSERKRDRRSARPLPAHAPDDDTKTRKSAERIWQDAVPLSRGDLVSRYLAARAVDLEKLAEANDGKLPGSLRFHPRVWNGETRRHYPAMVAKIVGLDGQFLALHRTWLVEGEDGRVTKAHLEDPKMTLGRYRQEGGAIRLWGVRWGEATDGDMLGLSEGIEDGLTAALLYPSWRVAAGVSQGGLLSIAIPSVLVRITLIMQNDLKPQAIQLLARIRDRFRREGRELSLLRVPREVKDLNELAVKFGKRRNAGAVG